MTLSLRWLIIVCVGFCTPNEFFCTCENAVETETGLPLPTTVEPSPRAVADQHQTAAAVAAAAAHDENRTPNSTRDENLTPTSTRDENRTPTSTRDENRTPTSTRDRCCSGPAAALHHGDDVNSTFHRATTTVVAKRLPPSVPMKRDLRKTNQTAATTAKPKAQKSAAAAKTASQNGSKFAKSARPEQNVTALADAVWPKHDKRLGGNNGGASRKPAADDDDAAAAAATAKAPPNRTDESTIVMTNFKAMYPIDVWKDRGLYTDDYLKLINAHWFKFVPPNGAAHYVLGFLYAVIMVFGCFGNSLVIFMYIKCKSLQTPANVLIMNLAVSDFFMLAKTPVFIYNSYYQGPALGKLGCQIYGFFGGLTGTVSIMTLAAISLDRYYVIVHPLNAAVKTSKQRARVWIGLIWAYGFCFSVVPVLDLGYNRYVPEGYLTSCSFDYLTDVAREKWFIVTFFAAAWCVPFATISYCYMRILRAVWVTGEMAASRFGQEEEKRKTEIRLGYVVVGVIVLWFVSWTPYAVVALLGVFDRKEYITPLNSMVPALFCKAASCMDPWIYAITHPRFKNELTKLLSRKKARKLERDYGMKKGWSHSNKSGHGFRNQSSTEDEDVEEVIVMVDPGDKVHRQGSTTSHKTNETRALETKFPPTRQESVKYMPPSWYKMPRTSSKSSIKVDAKPAADVNNK